MTKFVVNPTRTDPYKSFPFRLKIDGREVAGVTSVSALKEPVGAMGLATGIASRTGTSPTAWNYEPITLDRGVTHDSDFWKWASSAHAGKGIESRASTAGSRKDLVLEQVDESGKLVSAVRLLGAWVTAAEGGSPLAASGAVSMASLKIQCDAWELVVS